MSSNLAISPTVFSPAKSIGFFERLKISYGPNLLLSVNVLKIIGTAIEDIPIAYRIGMFIATRAVLHCTACSTFRNIRKAKYSTQDFVSDLPISFHRDPARSSPSFNENPVDVVSNEASSVQGDEPMSQRAVSF
ncbi:hypothetical protein PM082_012352 [Marasmius tenuissimus]|nr:hypothetical protein PM082_012352 [Marasmius tenuissimus]